MINEGTSQNEQSAQQETVTFPIKISLKDNNKYAILLEHNDTENEAWYYFIKYQGNENALNKLAKDLEDVEFELKDDLSTFDIELEHLVSEQTAKEMTKIDLNAHSFHRKFDGKLDDIDFRFKNRESNNKKMNKIFRTIEYGRIDGYISDEDIDSEDLTDTPDTDTESISESDSLSESDEESPPPKKKRGIPPAAKQKIPRVAQIKQRHNKRH